MLNVDFNGLPERWLKMVVFPGLVFILLLGFVLVKMNGTDSSRRSRVTPL